MSDQPMSEDYAVPKAEELVLPVRLRNILKNYLFFGRNRIPEFGITDRELLERTMNMDKQRFVEQANAGGVSWGHLVEARKELMCNAAPAKS